MAKEAPETFERPDLTRVVDPAPSFSFSRSKGDLGFAEAPAPDAFVENPRAGYVPLKIRRK